MSAITVKVAQLEFGIKEKNGAKSGHRASALISISSRWFKSSGTENAQSLILESQPSCCFCYVTGCRARAP